MSVTIELADPNLAAVPGHVGVVPGCPGHPISVGTELRGRVEIIARGDRDHVPLTIDVERHQRVDGLARAGGVVLAHREEATAAGVDGHVRMAHVNSRRNGSRLAAAVLPVEALVFEIDETDGGVADGELAASIFVHASARVEPWWRDVGDRSGRVAPADDGAARLIRSQLRPVQVIAVPAHHLVAHVHGAFEEEVDRYGRGPGPEWSDFTVGHLPNGVRATATITGAMRPV